MGPIPSDSKQKIIFLNLDPYHCWNSPCDWGIVSQRHGGSWTPWTPLHLAGGSRQGVGHLSWTCGGSSCQCWHTASYTRQNMSRSLTSKQTRWEGQMKFGTHTGPHTQLYWVWQASGQYFFHGNQTHHMGLSVGGESNTKIISRENEIRNEPIQIFYVHKAVKYHVVQLSVNKFNYFECSAEQ